MELSYTYKMNEIKEKSLELLKSMISTPSLSMEESETAVLIEQYFSSFGIVTQRHKNNVWAINKHFNPSKPSILLNSHHDTVKPNKQYTLNPFEPLEKDGKLFGLGSNDAGGALTSLMAAFVRFYEEENLKYNLIIAATAEEEISGTEGVGCILHMLPKIEFAIVGEPTLMDLAIAEKGLMVLDCVAHGKVGHAAREEGDNAIYRALEDIIWFRDYKFDRVSETLGPVKMTVSVINAGKQHNVVPPECTFTVDVRTTDVYSNEEVMAIIEKETQSEILPRSIRLRPSSIAKEHPIVQAGIELGRNTYGSPTTSDQALIPVPSLKLGPGDSARSHSADEFIYLHELNEGIDIYVEMLKKIL